LKNCWHGQPGIEPTTTTLDLSSQSGAYDLSAMATPFIGPTSSSPKLCYSEKTRVDIDNFSLIKPSI